MSVRRYLLSYNTLMNPTSPNVMVLDHGSDTCKVGMASDRGPRFFIPTIAGYSRAENVRFVGYRAQQMADLLDICYPVEHGLITNWDKMERMWDYIIYKKMKVPPEECPILLTEAPFVAKENRETMCEIMFETFNFPAIHVALQGALPIYTAGCTTGVVLDIGHEITQVVPVEEGNIVHCGIKRVDFAGKDITNYLLKLVLGPEKSLKTPRNIALMKRLKERMCHVSTDFDTELMEVAEKTIVKKTYKLPDGKVVDMITDRIRAPEGMFKPFFLRREEAGIHKVLYSAIMDCSCGLRKKLFSNVVLSGGSALFTGMAPRLKSELTKLARPSTDITIVPPSIMPDAVWKGGSILASMSTFQHMWASKQEFMETGPAILHH